eukprot:CAMPEP_0115020530 /NCGR_PEP_ID=MMETSP0216-20121206/30224_1 /TAXON_ID=223996 /ORGANISM="Protocruzia adherens, Strain Boccale" /LENGTH=330 /DNA_ID=CAMNT_0002392469 /DNA_START=292 /DNA_END=1284 /DNA_ORIENTATION=-
MRAGIYDLSAPGGFSVVEDHPIPTYGPNDVIVKVITAAINPVDYKVVTPAMPFLRHITSHIAGRDIAGVVLAAGNKVSNLKLGDHVYGNTYGGALAEYTVADSNKLGKCPTNLKWQETAGIPVAGLTGYQVFQKNGLKFGDRTLIIGASGGCGLIGVQIAKAMGAHVIGVCSKRNADLVKAVGADEIIDYTQPDYEKQIEPKSLDFIYDVVSSPEDPDQEPWARPFLKSDATSPYSKINGSAGDWVRAILSMIFRVNFQRNGFDLHLMKANSEDFNSLAALIEKAKMTIPIDCELNLDNEGICKGFDRQKSRRAKGKIIFNITPDYTPLK